MKKLVSCYKGKAIGGTLGMPFEGYTNTNSIEFYKTLPDKMRGNDDLDLQVVWLETLLQNGFPRCTILKTRFSPRFPVFTETSSAAEWAAP